MSQVSPMPAAAPVSIGASVGEALVFLREKWRLICVIALASTVAQTAVSFIPVPNATWLPVSFLALSLVWAGVNAALIGLALRGSLEPAQIGRDFSKLWPTMAILGFFLFLMSVVALLIFGGVLLGPYADQLKTVLTDEQKVALMQRAIRERPGVIAGAATLFAIVWVFLTSRFYVAGPASIAEQRIIAFDTWPRTRGNMLRITAARLTLLAPALVLAGALEAIIRRVLGGPLDPMAAMTWGHDQPASFAIYALVSIFIQTALYLSLEAGLSAALYRRLRPAAK